MKKRNQPGLSAKHRSVPFDISLSLALESGGAPARVNYDAALGEAVSEMVKIVEASDPLELLTILDRNDDLAEALRLKEAFTKNTSTIFVLGIGGSTLGGYALSRALPEAVTPTPRVAFFPNLGTENFSNALDACDLRTTRFLAISKSGGTAETLMSTLLAASALRKGVGDCKLGEYFAIVTENRPSALRKFAEEIGCHILDHPTGIGGRYSVLSVVGLLPATLMGLDAKAVRAGAKCVVDNARATPGRDLSPAAGAALHLALLREGRLRESVLWSYTDKLETFGHWWRQLWAESLGKDGKGTTPVAAFGLADQHSQLQLFLDGPGDALFTLVSSTLSGAGPKVSAEDAGRLGLSYLSGKALGDLVDAGVRATAQTLARRGRPVRRIRLGTLDEYALGALFMYFILETILVGRLTGVDPFNQPAVEEGKRLAREYLEEK